MIGPRSLQARLAIAVGVAVTVLWIAAAGLTVRKLGHDMDEVFDAALRDAAHRLLPLALRGTHDRHGRERPSLVERMDDGDAPYTYLVWDRDGRVLVQSDDAQAADFPPFEAEGFVQTETHRLYYEQAHRGEFQAIAVAEPLSRRAGIAREMAVNLVLPLLLVIPLSLGAIFVAVRTSLRPVRELRAGLAERGARNLQPLRQGGLPSELAPIVGGINDLLERLRASFEAERSFAANAAHELRTPVAGAIAQAQRLRKETQDENAAARAKEIETTLKRLNALSEKLMQLARAEGARLRTGTEADMRPVLAMIARDLERFGPAGLDAGQRLKVILPEGPVLSDLDPDAFGILCRNLMENALRHGPQDDAVTVTLSPEGVLAVSNPGPVIAPAELARLTARFTRAEGAGDGTGLGLAIVQTIAERGNGTFELRSPATGRPDGFEARFALP